MGADIGGGDRSRLHRERAVIEVLQAPRRSHVPAGLSSSRDQPPAGCLAGRSDDLPQWSC